ncbi:MAG: ribose 5-phosphate isomerase B [Elusimicrobia bacterium]|nr:ribose 5-phosphate isomerase B [Elusimicrobiota bacterium]
MKIALGADHGGFDLKRAIHKYLEEKGHSVLNLGTDSTQPADYPDFAERVASAVARKEAERGIMVCGSGVGACIAANKVPGARAAVCHDTFSARQGVEDDDMNVLCLGARVIGPQLALDILESWLKARFSDQERHRRRLSKVLAIEGKYLRASN